MNRQDIVNILQINSIFIINKALNGYYQKEKIQFLQLIKQLYLKVKMGKHDFEPKPDPPKKALSAFFLYRGEVYEKVKNDNPELRITQITKLIGEMWAKVDEAHKSRLEAIYQKNREIAARDKEEYESKYGKIERRRKRVAKRR